MVRNVAFLSRELESLLVEARADVRARELSPADIDLGALVGQVATAFDGVSEAHGVVVEVLKPVRAFVDPDAMHQVLGHLIDNAIKYSPDGGLVMVRASESDGAISISVADEGIGLPPAVDVFEAFRRGNPQEPGVPGIGLGLHIVRNLVEAMGGTVTARSNPDGGSTFTATLPAAAEAGGSAEAIDLTDAIITLAYYDAEGRLVDSEELRVSPDAGSVWIKPSEKILSRPAVRMVRASLARSPVTPIDINVHLLRPAPGGQAWDPLQRDRL